MGVRQESPLRVVGETMCWLSLDRPSSPSAKSPFVRLEDSRKNMADHRRENRREATQEKWWEAAENYRKRQFSCFPSQAAAVASRRFFAVSRRTALCQKQSSLSRGIPPGLLLVSGQRNVSVHAGSDTVRLGFIQCV